MQLLTRKDRDGELPAVIVKNTARRAENMADAKKFARCVQTDKKRKSARGKKNCKKIRRQQVCCCWQSRATSAACVLASIYRLPKGSFFPPTLVMQSGFDHIHLNGEGQKKFRQFVVRNMAAKKPQVAVRAGCCAARSFLRGCMGRVCTGKFLTGAGFARPNQRLATA